MTTYTTFKLWEKLDIAFIQLRNITFTLRFRYVFFSTILKKRGDSRSFYSSLKELSESCDFEDREEAIIRDIFITNMLDDDIQRELLRHS